MSWWDEGLAEGRAATFEDFDDFDAFEDEDDFDDFDDLDGFDDFDGDAMLSEDEALRMLEDVAVSALATDDADEFFRRLWRGVRGVARGIGRGIGRAARTVGRVARTVGRGIGQVSRVVGPIASLIPIPQVQAVGRLASVLGRVLFDEADEFDALDDLFDLAEEDDSSLDLAAPIVAAVTIRRMVPGVARMPVAARRRLVHSVTTTTRRLTRTQGPAAIRATPAVVRRVTTRARRVGARPAAVATAIQRAGAQLVRRPAVVRRLTQAAVRPAARRQRCPSCGHAHRRAVRVRVA